MDFQNFSKALLKLEGTSSRLEMTEQLAQLYGQLEGDEIVWASYLFQGKLVPTYESLEFNLSVKMVIRVLARLLNKKDQSADGQNALNLFGEQDFSQLEAVVTASYKELGDIGLVAQKIMEDRVGESGHQKDDKQLSIEEVFIDLTKIARVGGTGSQEVKVTDLVGLLRQLDSLSARYVTRVVVGKLRLGFSTMTMLDALSWSVVGDKSESDFLELIYQRRADVGQLAKLYLGLKNEIPEVRKQKLAKIKVEVGVPVMPALCQRLNSASEIIEKMTEVYAEPKYDGLRVQIHFKKIDGDQILIKAFTRNLDDISHMFPELLAAVKQLNCESCVLDAEGIGFHADTGKLMTFQETITRRRKHGVSKQAEQIPIRFYVFDVLSKDGKSLLDEKLRTRKDVLKGLFSQNEVFFQTPYFLTSDPNKLKSYHQEQLTLGLEGAVMKQPDSLYVSGRKGWNWVKIKEAEGTTGKLSDTIDAVVMGYYYGRGKRTQFGLGAILVGALDDAGEVLTIAKIGTGLSDDQLRLIKEQCQKLATKTKPQIYQVHKNLEPDVWVEPKIVVEIAADEVTNSPTHTAGVALRFPRLIKVRDDKGVDQATTLEEVKKL